MDATAVTMAMRRLWRATLMASLKAEGSHERDALLLTLERIRHEIDLLEIDMSEIRYLS